jgi:hypothetical protein
MSALQSFFQIILEGESKTYNDHNWYTSGGLRGYIEGRGKPMYPLLTKPLSEYTLGEVKNFQAQSRSGNGQLWATGRYQIIPNTLKGLQADLNLPDSTKYNVEIQDKMGLQLLLNRKSLKDYITSAVPDSKENLEKASLAVSQIWSSVGVPYDTIGRHGNIKKNQSFYAGGGDKASVNTEIVQEKLKELRRTFKFGSSEEKSTEPKKSKKGLIITLVSLSVIGIGFAVYKLVKNKTK